MDLYFPNSGWLRVGRETLDRLQEFKVGRSRPNLGSGVRRAIETGRGGRPMTAGLVDRLAAARSVADAVLYEGYVLYPYRASSRKNQMRWQFGVLAPRSFSEADGSERWSMRTECLVPGQ